MCASFTQCSHCGGTAGTGHGCESIHLAATEKEFTGSVSNNVVLTQQDFGCICPSGPL